MELKEFLGYEGKNVVITGAGSGMGLAAAKLLADVGANVYATVRRQPLTFPVTKEIRVDLGCKDELDRLIGELPESIDALFICHGISDKPGQTNAKEVQLTNFYSFKYLTGALLPRIPADGSITFISSNGGQDWRSHVADCESIINTNSWEEAEKWYEDHPDATKRGYVFSKECQHTYVISNAQQPEFAMARKRINAIAPGYTLTGLSDDFNKSINGDAEFGKQIIEKMYLSACDGRPALPEEMGYPLVIVGSNVCSYMTGQILYIDYGTQAAWEFNQIKEKTLLG